MTRSMLVIKLTECGFRRKIGEVIDFERKYGTVSLDAALAKTRPPHSLGQITAASSFGS